MSKSGSPLLDGRPSARRSCACARKGAFLQFALLTGQRRTEIATMQRSEIELAARLWSIPAAKSKNRKVHLVPLSTMAVDILASLPVIDDRFVWSTMAGTHISG